jgi:hypothetical protein
MPATRRCTAFGLDLHTDAPVRSLTAGHAQPTGRALHLRTDPASAGQPDWPHDGETLCDERLPNGSICFRIEAHAEAGYLIWGPDYGAHLLSRDGRLLRCATAHACEWERLLIAQVLPFAALLQGLEVLHASAVAIDNAAIALAGPSGAGKTSVALELCRLGNASFITDDVLALEASGDRLLAHPGPPIAGLDRAEAARLERTGGQRRSALWTNAHELMVRAEAASEPAALAALFLLDRRLDGPKEPRFAPLVGAGPLLASTFNFVLGGASRLRGLLDVCALAAAQRAERVIVGPAVDATALADAIAQRVT